VFGARIFMSYATECTDSKRILTALEPVLREAAHHVFRDVNLQPSDAWRDELAKELERCDGAVLLLGPEALKSDWVPVEANLLALRRRARGPEHFVLITWLLPGVGWNDLEDRFPVGDLKEFQYVVGLQHSPESIEAHFRRLAGARKALCNALASLSPTSRRDIAAALDLEMPGRGGLPTQVEDLVDLAVRAKVYDELWERVRQRSQYDDASADLEQGLAEIVRFLDGRRPLAQRLRAELGGESNAELAGTLVSDARRTLRALVNASVEHRLDAQQLAQRVLPWTPAFRDRARTVPDRGVVEVDALHPAHASLPLAARVGAQPGLAATPEGLASRSQVKLPAAMSADVRRTADTLTDALCKLLMESLQPHVAHLDQHTLRILARHALRELQSLDPELREFRYFVDEHDDVLAGVAEHLPELFVVVLRPDTSDPGRIGEQGAIMGLLAKLFPTERAR